MQINEQDNARKENNEFVLFNLGFRIFFLAAGSFSILAIAIWSAVFHFQMPIAFGLLASSQWHAHEMIYGYTLAVIAGFLLTAVKNWTGVQAVTGILLAVIVSFWVVARLCFMFGEHYFLIAAAFDILFSVAVFIAVAYPVVKVRQWNHSVILIVLILLTIFNGLFYLGASGTVEEGVVRGLYGGLYVVVGLILIMGRRVIPFFIERGVGYDVTLFNSKWLDISIISFLCLFMIFDLFVNAPAFTAFCALAVFVASSVRLVGWYTKGIWAKSMLWSIYIASWCISVGFLLLAGRYFFDVSKFLGIHALSVGGIGLITMGMMARVALGHTGRDVSQPPTVISYALGILAVAAFVRVVLPLFNPVNYILWLGISQLLWIIAFAVFTIIYWPILSKPRVDSQPG